VSRAEAHFLERYIFCPRLLLPNSAVRCSIPDRRSADLFLHKSHTSSRHQVSPDQAILFPLFVFLYICPVGLPPEPLVAGFYFG